MRIALSVFTRREEGTYHRAMPWAAGLASAGHDVTLLCLSPARRFACRRDMQDGVRIVETPCLGDGRSTLRKLSGMSGWGPLDMAARLRELSTGTFDVVHLFEHHPNVAIPSRLARRHARLTVVDGCDHYGRGGLRDKSDRPRLDPLYRVLGAPLRGWLDAGERRLRRGADGVTAISRFLRDRALAFGVPAERVAVIPGGADTRRIRPMAVAAARAITGVEPDRPVALFLGAALFDLDLALEAARLAAARLPRLLLLIAGPGSAGLDRLVRRHAMAAHVRIVGWVPEERLPEWLGSADVCLLPMRDTPMNRARWPNKIGHYMAAGRPTVCSAIGDVADLVREAGAGMVAATAGEFAAAITTLAAQPGVARRMGTAARLGAERRLDRDAQTRLLLETYQRFAAVRPGGCLVREAHRLPLADAGGGSLLETRRRSSCNNVHW